MRTNMPEEMEEIVPTAHQEAGAERLGLPPKLVDMEKVKVANAKADPFNVKRSFASKAFTDAWTVLKNYGANAPKMPPTEEESYGGISHRNHPLFGQPGYRPSRLEAPTPLDTDEPKPLPPPTFDEEYSGALQDMPENEMDMSTPSNPFRGESMSPQKAKLMAMIHSLMQG